MDPEIGKVYDVQGKPQRYKGGDPNLAASWEDLTATPAEQPSKRIPMRDAGRMALQSASFGFADNIVGKILGEGAGEASRERVAQIRHDYPKQAFASEVVGAIPSMLIPVGAGVQGARAGAGLLNIAGRGAAVGLLEGQLQGMGDADEQETVAGRAKEALPQAGLSGLLGGALAAIPGATNVVGRWTSQRGTRIAAGARRTSMVMNTLRRASDEATQAIEKARADFYKPLEQQFAQVTDPDIMQIVTSDEVQRYLPRGLRSNPRRPPSLEELQTLRTRLKRVDREGLYQQLDDAMQNGIPGLQQADAAYRRAMQMRTAITSGRKLWNSSADDITSALEQLPPDAHMKFREGMMHEVTSRLRRRDTEAVSVLKEMMDMGPESVDRISQLFEGGAQGPAFREFQAVIGRERSAARVADAFNRLAKVGAVVGVVGGAVTGNRMSRRDMEVVAP